MFWCSCGNKAERTAADEYGRNAGVIATVGEETLGCRCCLGGGASAEQEQADQTDDEQYDRAWLGNRSRCAARGDRRERAVNRVENEGRRCAGGAIELDGRAGCAIDEVDEIRDCWWRCRRCTDP